MALDAPILDSAYRVYDEFGPDLRVPRPERLRREYPELSDADLAELVQQMESVSKTVWTVAERGGEAKMKKEQIVALLQEAHPFLKHEGLSRAVFLVNYYAWHEGFSK